MKRKAEDDLSESSPEKKSKAHFNGLKSFREDLFGQEKEYQQQYVKSEPFQHGVIRGLLDPQLLRNVRSEIQENLSFTPKETDIYKIHQSGDLANLDGLEDSSLQLLPSLLALRNALYSSEFRTYLSNITQAGPLSGKKTDMAINVYTPGCHLLCHDDVIGSRRVSYILYLTDPDRPWKEEWGGALRLYPTLRHQKDDGQEVKVPSPDFSVSIPPAFNQLSFFAVQPGESFHDVEEIYAGQAGSEDVEDDGRIRMAISGWYHIPQEGEEGHVRGIEDSSVEKSSLKQLQGSGDKYDFPQPAIGMYSASEDEPHSLEQKTNIPLSSSQDEQPLSEVDLDFLLKYISPNYLVPDTLESISQEFGDQSSLCLETFLSKNFSNSLRTFITEQESQPLPPWASEIESHTQWTVARPPHKHRFLYQQVGRNDDSESSNKTPLHDLLVNLLPSDPFRKWLQLATNLKISSHDLLARRFRRGKDYTLATGYTEENPRLEIILAITPSTGWENVDDEPELELANETEETVEKSGKPQDDGAEESAAPPSNAKLSRSDTGDVGGYIAYMAADNDDDDDAASKSDSGVEIPRDLSTGGHASSALSRSKTFSTSSSAAAAATTGPKPPKSDPAIYQSSTAAGDDEDDESILFSMPAGWNKLGIVLRDRGVLRLVKYVSRQAKGDRWDLVGEYGVVDEDGEEEEEEEEKKKEEREQIGAGAKEEEESTEVEWREGDEVETEDTSDSG